MCYVYVITDHQYEGADAEYLKIGYTTDPKISNRLRAIQTGNPRFLYVHSVLELKDADMARSTERHIHWILRDHRLNGEWFKANDKVKLFILEVMPTLGFYFYGNPEDIFLDTGVA